MKQIRVLSPQVANRIAAGEVIERPSSVVKELVENAIDAGATAITVEIENGGIDYIRVSDNGSGIPADECATAFLRHATSKIAVADDISRITTLGFRGEALPSIASVAEVTLKTRTKNAENGTLLQIDNGELIDQHPIACTDGTVLEVRNLFSKTPARLKFLKNPRTEAGYIGDYLSRMIMAMPEISFAYVNNGKTVYRTYGDGSLKNSLFSIYGASILPQLRDVFYDDGYLRITGYVGTAAVARPNRMQQSLYLNGRYIRSFSISNAVQRAYDTRLMVGKFPFFVLFLRIAGTEVDVNVHPTKMEVRFADDRRVCSAIYSACVRALEKPIDIIETEIVHEEARGPVLRADSADKVHDSTDLKAKQYAVKSVCDAIQLETKSVSKKGEDVAWGSASADKPQQPILSSPELRKASPQAVVTVHESAHGAAAYSTFPKHNITVQPQSHPQKPASSIPIFEIVSHAKQRDQMIKEIKQEEPVRFGAEDYRLIGAAFSGYWIIEQGDTLFLIDQHAAHERKLYEELMARRVEPAKQTLLFPERIKVSPGEFALIQEYQEEIEHFGFSFCFADAELELDITAVPVIRGTALEAKQLLEALEALVHSGSVTDTDLCRNSLIQTACKHAIKVNEPISRAEIQHLLAEVAEGKVPMTCPHGRPIMVRLTKLEIEKMFKRVL